MEAGSKEALMLQYKTAAAWILLVVVALVTLRFLSALDAGVHHITILRTYAFWAIVAMPVALLGDHLARTILSYRATQTALARIRSSDHR